jgi:hypothetical protein
MNGETAVCIASVSGRWQSVGLLRDPRGARHGAHLRATDLYAVGSFDPDHDPSRASAAKLRAAGPFYRSASSARFEYGFPPPRIVNWARCSAVGHRPGWRRSRCRHGASKWASVEPACPTAKDFTSTRRSARGRRQNRLRPEPEEISLSALPGFARSRSRPDRVSRSSVLLRPAAGRGR